jgi:thiol-disulfide isomerase/thioredoxin
MNPQKTFISILLAAAVIGGIIYLNSQKAGRSTKAEVVTVVPRASSVYENTQPSTISSSAATSSQSVKDSTPQVKKETMPTTYLSALEKSKRYELAKEITTPDGFINSNGQPITIGQYVGKKVILVDFWTYSCINCQRTTPYLNAWYEKYKDEGFVIVGIHTPEFEFEKVYQNVLDATKKEGIKYPVVLDNDYSTWNAYQNRFWPRKYLIDIDGYVIYDHIGEGGYEETEQKIQEALKERMAVLGENGTIDQSVIKEASVVGGPRSPETYFGAARNQNFGNGSPGATGDQKGLTIPTQPALNTLYLSGDWNLTNEFAQNSSPYASIVYKYNSKDVFLVSESSQEAVVEVLLDGKPLGVDAGSDIVKTADGKTVVKIKEARLYKIIQGKQSEIHTLKFIIQKSELKAFAFTFG